MCLFQPLSSHLLSVVSLLAIYNISNDCLAQMPGLPSPGPIIISQAAPGAGTLTVAAPAAKMNRRVVRGEAGDWGRLEYFQVVLEAPDALISKFPLPNSRPRWALPEASLPMLGDFFAKAGLDAAFITALLDPTSVSKSDGMVYLFPPLDKLEAMPSSVRATVYAELRNYQLNEFQYEPVVIASDDVDDWFHESDLRPELIAKIKQMSYLRGQTLVFSDLPLLLNFVTGEDEGRTLLKACTRTRSLVAKLLLDKKSDLTAIIDYWTTGLNTRRKDLQPMLDSVVDTDGVDGLDLNHMLPPLARKLLMT